MKISLSFSFTMTITWSVVRCSIANNSEIIQVQGNYRELMEFKFNNAVNYLLNFKQSSSDNPYRIQVWSRDASVDAPVIVVVWQEREVTSWQIPFGVETFRQGHPVYFDNSSRTLCEDNMLNISRTKLDSSLTMKPRNFIVALSTWSTKNVNVSVYMEEMKNFYLKTGKNYSIAVSPTQTAFFYYQFPTNKFDRVVVEINSTENVCLTVSIQNISCPVFDLDEDITYVGKYQTMNKKTTFNIMKKEYPNGFYLVFVVKADDDECNRKYSLSPKYRFSAERISIVSFVVNKGVTWKESFDAFLITFGVIGLFYLVAIVLEIPFKTFIATLRLGRNRRNNGEINNDSETVAEPPLPEDNNSINVEIDDDSKTVRAPLLTQEDNRTNVEIDNDSETVPEIVVFNQRDKRDLLEARELTVNQLMRTKSSIRSFKYLWIICIIVIFYGIPVIQLINNYLMVVMRTGDEDMCYYNSLCAIPASIFFNFNNVFSNIGYLAAGILFLIMVRRRQKRNPNKTTGIPPHYDVFYVMGMALIVEGILSACYHVCPNQSNFQFDISFMYVMAVLCMIKLYQSRHSDISASPYVIFIALGFANFLAVIGLAFDNLIFLITFGVVYWFLCVFISLEVYFLSFIREGFNLLKERWICSREVFTPVKKRRRNLIIIINIVNYVALISGLILCGYEEIDFGTFLLLLLIGNSGLHALVYTRMKCTHGERICFEARIYGVLGAIIWGLAIYYFLQHDAIWAVSPADSRKLNHECILMKFYDAHDVWHFLSAIALYFTFMFFLYLDNDLIEKNREHIVVF